MKKYIGLSIIALGMGLTSCGDFLDKLPDNRTEANTEEKIQKLLVAAYPTHEHMAFTEFASDNVDDMGESNPNTERFLDEIYSWTDVTETNNADPEGYIYRINNPADLSKVRRTDISEPGLLLFVGRLSEEKNIGLIIRAISAAGTYWKLRLVGDGKERANLEKLADELGVLQKLEFVGWSDDPWKYAQGAYAFIMSSVYEGSPLAAIEALSCGLPVIGNVSSGVAELVRPGVNGYLYHDGDHEELAAILDYIYEGKFPPIDSENCRKSVVRYDSSISLLDFQIKLLATLSGKIIEDQLYK